MGIRPWHRCRELEDLAGELFQQDSPALGSPHEFTAFLDSHADRYLTAGTCTAKILPKDSTVGVHETATEYSFG